MLEPGGPFATPKSTHTSPFISMSSPSMEPGSNTQDGVVNMTRAMEALSPWLNNPRWTIIQVEALVALAAVLLLLHLILGSCKRRWHNSAVNGVLLVCHALMFPLFLYTWSMMQSSPIKNSLYPVWSIFLIMASMGTSAVQQYDFYGEPGKKFVQYTVEMGRLLFYFYIIIQLLSPTSMKENLLFSLPSSRSKDQHQQHVHLNWRATIAGSFSVFILASIVIVKKYLESTGLVGLDYDKMMRLAEAAERMEERANDHPCDDSDPADDSIKGYNFLVMQRVEVNGSFCSTSREYITTDQVWDSCSDSEDGRALRDVCLSYALFRQLLARRYFGVGFPRATLVKTHDFVFKKLLPSEGDFRRAFRVIEVELGFCYDFFFTKYHVNFLWTEESSLLSWILLPLFLGKIFLIVVVGVFTLRKSVFLRTPNPIIEVHSTDADYTITLLVLGVALIVEFLQAAIYLTSDWVQVLLACRYVKKNCRHAANVFVGKVIGLFRRVIISGQLSNKIGQSSFLFFDKLTKQSVEVSDTVKRAIARSLISTYGDQTNNEETSLRPQNQQMFGWTFKDQSQLETMLVWHIATEYCVYSDEDLGDVTTDPDMPERVEVAVHLSRYCAYLIVSVPELLPYEEVEIRELARQMVEDFKGMSCTYAEMKNLEGTEEGDDPRKIFIKGVKLGKQLERSAQRWKVMEEFWTETVICVARSPRTVKQHMKHLENGGEFLTHVWALLSHAGFPNIDKYKDQGWGFRTQSHRSGLSQEENV